MDRGDPKLALEAPLLENKKSNGKGEVSTELKKQLCLAGPLSVVSFLQFSLSMISVMFIGHLGELRLSGCSMANSFAGVTGFSLMVMP